MPVLSDTLGPPRHTDTGDVSATPGAYAATVTAVGAGTVDVVVPGYSERHDFVGLEYLAPGDTPSVGDDASVVFSDDRDPVVLVPGAGSGATGPTGPTGPTGAAGPNNVIVGKTVPTLGAGQDGYGWVYNHGTGAMVWTRQASKAELDTHAALTTTAHGGLIASSEKAAASGVASLDGSSRIVQNPKLHASAHQPGGADAMAVDAAAATGSLRTLGTGAAQAAAGNDARLSDTRTPTDGTVTNAKVDAAAAIAESKLNLASDAAAGTASRRTIGKTALKAADGADTEYAFSAYRDLTDWRITTLAAGVAASTFLVLYTTAASGTPGTATVALYLDPADFPGGTRTAKLRIRAAVVTNAVAPGINFTFHLYPVATWGGASGAAPTVASLGASVGNVAINTPAAGGPTFAASSDFNFPAAGWYVLALVTSGTTAANSSQVWYAQLQQRQV